MADQDRRFDPSDVEVNLSREQGLGFGQRELDRQHDPDQSPQTPLELHNGDSANPEEAWGEPADEGAAYSANHATRGEKTDAERGPGPKTRQATKDAISRGADHPIVGITKAESSWAPSGQRAVMVFTLV